jgi:hypothetical protein
LYFTPVSLFAAVTWDLGTAAPLESVTVPTRLLSMAWAHSRIALKANPGRIRLTVGTIDPFFIRRTLVLRKEVVETVARAVRLSRWDRNPQQAEIPRYLKELGRTRNMPDLSRANGLARDFAIPFDRY